MLSDIKEQLRKAIAGSLQTPFKGHKGIPAIEIDYPHEKMHGDFSCNIALKSAKILNRPPLELATEFQNIIREQLHNSSSGLDSLVERIETKKPGFLNFFLSTKAVYGLLAEVLRQKDQYGRQEYGQRQKIQIEFVSANPTGPLSVAHARQAAVGDALGNILKFVGYDALKEYYVNDEGNQIDLLGQSIGCRVKEKFGLESQIPEDGYQGDYVREVAEAFIIEHNIHGADDLVGLDEKLYSEHGVDYLMNAIKFDLEDFGVHFEHWSRQSEIATQDAIEDMLAYLGEKGFTYEKDGALWFQSTHFDDDKDRVIEKSDGSYTYFTPDIVYHRDKFARGFKKVVNIWGPDHHGYIPRITAAVEALGQERDALQVLIVQLATLYRDGKPLQMSTRKGQLITLREIIDEVGVDAARFFFLLRRLNAHLDFDLELAKKETAENPVYYIQYAHARIHSIVKKANEAGLGLKTSDFTLLKEQEEVDLIKKIGSFPNILVLCSEDMDPYALANFLLELAAVFHKFYDRHRVVNPEFEEISRERLALIDAVRIVLANGLQLLGISQPEEM